MGDAAGAAFRRRWRGFSALGLADLAFRGGGAVPSGHGYARHRGVSFCHRNPSAEVLMAKQYRFRFKSLDVYQAAVAHFLWTVEVLRRLPKGPFVVPNQITGASLSIVGNIGEANGRDKQPGEIEQHYRYAQGSAFEAATHLEALSALGVITDDEYNAQELHLARISAMLTRLMQRERSQRTPLREKGGSQTRASKSRASGVEKPASAGVEKRRPQAGAPNLEPHPR
jgi:four helix bundle protein